MVFRKKIFLKKNYWDFILDGSMTSTWQNKSFLNIMSIWRRTTATTFRWIVSNLCLTMQQLFFIRQTNMEDLCSGRQWKTVDHGLAIKTNFEIMLFITFKMRFNSCQNMLEAISTLMILKDSRKSKLTCLWSKRSFQTWVWISQRYVL